MIEPLVLGSNVLVILLVGWLIRKVSAQETKCSEHMIGIAESLANRPKFDDMDKEIAKEIKIPDGKISLLRQEFRGHRHEGSKAPVVLET